MNRLFASMLVLGLLFVSDAQADMPKMDRGQREQMLKKIHTGFVLELGEILGLDTAGTIKLSERLAPYDKQRIQVRMETWDAVQVLKGLSAGKGPGNAAEIARRIAKNRVQLAQIDQEELEEIMKGIPADKVAKAALFLTEFPKRIERMAREIVRERMMKNGEMPGPGGERQPQDE